MLQLNVATLPKVVPDDVFTCPLVGLVRVPQSMLTVNAKTCLFTKTHNITQNILSQTGLNDVQFPSAPQIRVCEPDRVYPVSQV